MLIRSAFLIQNGSLLKDIDILIEGNRISEVGRDLRPNDDEVIDARNMLAVPGLVNSHTHLAMTLLRGYADDMELIPWLRDKIWPLEARLRPSDIRAGVRLGCLELIRFGVTCYNDMYYFMDETAAVTREMGIRGVLSGVLFDMRPELLDDVEPFIKKWRDDDLIKPAVGPHAVYTCSEETLLRAREISERYDVKIHIHLSETRDEVDTFVNQRRMTPVEFLESLGFLSERVVAAHCVWLTPRDMRILAERHVNVAHCPISNLKLASGIAPVATLIEQGVNVCLGTDGASSNNNLDIFEEMKVAAVVQKCAAGRPAILPADAVWRMATENAYRAFSLDIGIRPGALADLALINIKRPWFTPETSMLSHLVYSMAGGVCWTICNGRVLMRDGVIEGEEKILEEAQRSYERLISEE
ncbi:MAG: amidohydrolase [Methanothrix sp.]|uniref:amidohydrolase n=1 Tax=Methanothrix sp. TaxID=90426 RepID=UPI002600446C|nr:amidohydrolase [Methanothrix sp.]MCQ8902629.1 amidohydrolase [Methanothrix sp.]